MSCRTSPKSRFNYILWNFGSNLPLTWPKEEEITWKFSQKTPYCQLKRTWEWRRLSHFKMHDTPPKNTFSKNFRAFSSQTYPLKMISEQKLLFSLLKLNFHKVSIYLFAFETSFMEGYNKTSCSKKFKSHWLPRVNKMSLLTEAFKLLRV